MQFSPVANPLKIPTSTTSKMSPDHNDSQSSPSGGSHQIGNLGSSVVPDLMKVYESLTQSSTPHVDSASAEPTSYTHNQDNYQSPGQAQQQQQPYDQQYAAYDPPQGQDYHQEQHHQSYGEPYSYDSQEYQQQQQIAQQVSPMPPPPGKVLPDPPPPPALDESSSSSSQPTRSSTRKRSRTTPSYTEELKEPTPRGSGGRSNSRGSKSRKKSSKTDGRWSKRFQWPDELHREFVSAVFDVGLKHSSPSAIMEHMPHNETITSERVKSHLQKYRLHRARSKKEFMASYDTAAAKFRKDAPDGYLVNEGEISALASGEVAAHLSCVASAMDDAAKPPPPTQSSYSAAGPAVGGAVDDSAAAAAAVANGGVLHLPQLTEEEKRSPIGASLGYMMGLFFALQQQLSHQRAHQQAEKEKKATIVEPVAAPLTNPAGPGYGTYVAPPQQIAASSASAAQQPPYGSAGAQQQSIPTSSSTMLDENKMMKRDMRAQMKLQNQMRAFKDKEVAKVQQQPTKSETPDQTLPAAGEAAAGETSSGEGAPDGATATAANIVTAAQYAGAGRQKRSRAASFSDTDIWDTSVEDSELFEFLMS